MPSLVMQSLQQSQLPAFAPPTCANVALAVQAMAEEEITRKLPSGLVPAPCHSKHAALFAA
eukprot:1413878-Pleurochrysis_carterae.AAC.1